MEKQTVALFFGGKTTEHEVSVITALQAYEHLDKTRYSVVPVYVTKDNQWYTSDKLLHLKNYKDIPALLLAATPITFGRKNGQSGILTYGFRQKFTPIHMALLAFHGSFGEDGSMQGLLELLAIPYTSFGVAGSAVAMDKVFTKAVFAQLGLPQAAFTVVYRQAWNANQEASIRSAEEKLKYPMFVKPATIGSSIGVGKARNRDELEFALEVAFTYAEKVLIEKAFTNVIEVNCSALGFGEDVAASVCEQPVASADVLSFADKYQRGGKGSKGQGMASLSRIIPAPISKTLTSHIQATTIEVFKALNGCGVARIDFFVDPQAETFWVNEVNAIPGSLSFYLWEKSGLPYAQLLDRLLELAKRRQAEQQKTQYTFNAGLLTQMAILGGSGSKA